jgi:hypothetical protein
VKKEEADAPPPPLVRKTRRLRDDAEGRLQYRAPNYPEEFPGLRAAERISFNEVQPGTLEYVLVWSWQDTKKKAVERGRRLDLFVNLENDDEAGPSQRRYSDDQDCSSWSAKVEPSSDDNNDDDGASSTSALTYSILVFFVFS